MPLSRKKGDAMPLPTLSHLQFQIIGILKSGEQSGQYVRDVLAQQGVKKSGPGFYQLMARLEDAGFVKGRYEQLLIDGQAVKERRYTVTASGVRAWDATLRFYKQQESFSRRGGLGYA
jgi:DNA-binding PadR family transcriptional regulator